MPITIDSTSWLTARRLRAHGLILGVCLWSVYLWNITAPGLLDRGGVVKGADFIHLYTLGSVALEHRTADLYDAEAQAKITAQRVPSAAGVSYIPLYPPQISIFFAPLAALPYHAALVIWLILNSLIYALCSYLFWLSCPQLRSAPGTVLLLACAFPGFFHMIVWGQTSAMALACFTAAFFFLRDQRPFLAGLALGCLIFKLPLGIAASVIFIYTRAWRVIAGAVLSAAVQLAVPAFYYGVESLRLWMRMMIGVAYSSPLLEPRPYQTHSLRTFWTMLLPGLALPSVLYTVSAIVILGFTLAIWSRPRAVSLSLRYAALLLASVLVAPHLIVYDLAILAPVFILLSDWIAAQGPAFSPTMKTVLYLAYLSPLVGPLSRWTHLQISVVLMSILLYLIWSASRDSIPAVAG
jgi:hypothetical protein